MNPLTVLGEQVRELGTWSSLKGALGIFLAWLLEAAGHPGVPFIFLFYLMLFDLTLGLTRASRTIGLKQARLARGAMKFFWYWLAVVIMGHVDVFILPHLPKWVPFGVQYALTAYLAVNEALSCCEHLLFFGVPLPARFISVLRNYRDNFAAAGWDGIDRRKAGGE